jgi:hypothetical protein
MTEIHQDVAASPAERTVLPPRHELAAQAEATWSAWKETTRYELALTLVKMKMGYNASIREISEETTIPRSTVHKLIAWHYAGYPACGPFSKPPVEHQPEEEDGPQPGPGQHQPSRAQQQITSLTLQLRDMTEHAAELEAGREPVTLVEGKRSKEEIRTLVVASIASKKDFAWLRAMLDDDYDAFPEDEHEDDNAGGEQASDEQAGGDAEHHEQNAVEFSIDPDDPAAERKLKNAELFDGPEFLKRNE